MRHFQRGHELAEINAFHVPLNERGRNLFDAVQRLDLDRGQAEGQSLRSRVTWFKIKNRAYTQMEGRGELSNGQR